MFEAGWCQIRSSDRKAKNKMSSFPQKKGPWTTISSELKYLNPWISVREDQILRPDGQPGIYGIVEPKHAVGVVAVAPHLENNVLQVYLVGQYRYATQVYSWEIIEGGSEEGEDPLQTGKRELKEEAGLVANEWQMLGNNIQLSNSHSTELATLFLATGLSIGQNSPDPTEELEVRSLDFSKAVEMTLSGEISDALTIMGLLLAKNKFDLVGQSAPT